MEAVLNGGSVGLVHFIHSFTYFKNFMLCDFAKFSAMEGSY